MTNDTFPNEANGNDDNKFVTSLAIKRFDEQSIPKTKNQKDKDNDEDGSISSPVRKEACFERRE